jgi:hypothetical protein
MQPCLGLRTISEAEMLLWTCFLRVEHFLTDIDC